MVGKEEAAQGRVLGHLQQHRTAGVEPQRGAGGSVKRHRVSDDSAELRPVLQGHSDARQEVRTEAQGHHKLQRRLHGPLLGNAEGVGAQGRSRLSCPGVRGSRAVSGSQEDHALFQAQQQQQHLGSKAPGHVGRTAQPRRPARHVSPHAPQLAPRRIPLKLLLRGSQVAPQRFQQSRAFRCREGARIRRWKEKRASSPVRGLRPAAPGASWS